MTPLLVHLMVLGAIAVAWVHGGGNPLSLPFLVVALAAILVTARLRSAFDWRRWRR